MKFALETLKNYEYIFLIMIGAILMWKNAIMKIISIFILIFSMYFLLFNGKLGKGFVNKNNLDYGIEKFFEVKLIHKNSKISSRKDAMVSIYYDGLKDEYYVVALSKILFFDYYSI